MKKLLMALALIGSANCGDVDDIRHRALDLDKHFDVFERHLFGCGASPMPTDNAHCRISSGRIDYAEYDKARNAAKRLFGFVE